MDLRAGQTRWPGNHIPQPGPCRGRGPAHGLLRAGPRGSPGWIPRPGGACSASWHRGRAAVGAGHVRSPGWRGWPGGVEGCVCVCWGAPSLPAALSGPAKWQWSRAQVPTCLVTGLLFEKLKQCQDNLTSALLSGGWSRPGGGLFVQGGQWEGARGRSRLSGEYYPASAWAETESNRTQHLGRAKRHTAADTRCWPRACPGPTVCWELGEAAGTRLMSPGGPGPGCRKPFQLLKKSELKKNEPLG